MNDDPNDDGAGREKQNGTRSVKDLDGSAANVIAEAEDTTTKGLRSILDEERKKREQAEQRASDERKKRKQAKREAKARIRVLEQKLKVQEASSSSGRDQKK
jgi:flagellar motility protein MotE (MotC chaperone)